MICVCQYDGWMLLPDSMAKGTENRLLFEFVYNVVNIEVIATEGGLYRLVDTSHREERTIKAMSVEGSKIESPDEKAIEILKAGDFTVKVEAALQGVREAHIFQILIRDVRATVRNLSVLVGANTPMRFSFAASDWLERAPENSGRLH